MRHALLKRHRCEIARLAYLWSGRYYPFNISRPFIVSPMADPTGCVSDFTPLMLALPGANERVLHFDVLQG